MLRTPYGRNLSVRTDVLSNTSEELHKEMERTGVLYIQLSAGWMNVCTPYSVEALKYSLHSYTYGTYSVHTHTSVAKSYLMLLRVVLATCDDSGGGGSG